MQNIAPAPPTSGDSEKQGVSLTILGDVAMFLGCKFLGAHDNLGRHYYNDCLIEGSIDFIF
ncbi:putative pectinesterase [Lupinus albus]|uniref:pectinesterase n=1 Tax=Lupinus albus TaxID=3870 RepID=A0A6A4NFE9_LUPAL|nr:putative pectinesterase [Lupinus albus]